MSPPFATPGKTKVFNVNDLRDREGIMDLRYGDILRTNTSFLVGHRGCPSILWKGRQSSLVSVTSHETEAQEAHGLARIRSRERIARNQQKRASPVSWCAALK
jgi:hypothetical protein